MLKIQQGFLSWEYPTSWNVCLTELNSCCITPDWNMLMKLFKTFFCYNDAALIQETESKSALHHKMPVSPKEFAVMENKTGDQWVVKHLESVACHRHHQETPWGTCTHLQYQVCLPREADTCDVVCSQASKRWSTAFWVPTVICCKWSPPLNINTRDIT